VAHEIDLLEVPPVILCVAADSDDELPAAVGTPEEIVVVL
jgi:hypothetical protein